MDNRSSFNNQRGGVLLTTMMVAGGLAVAAVSYLSLGLNTYQVSTRNDALARAQSIADSELEYLFFKLKQEVTAGVPPAAIPRRLAESGIATNADLEATPSNVQYTALLGTQLVGDWRVRRSLTYDEAISGFGQIPGGNNTGSYRYFRALVEVIPPTNTNSLNKATSRRGRVFANFNYSLFQYSVFFQGDMEMTPGTDTVINGDIATMGDLYLASASPATLRINDLVKLPIDKNFNELNGNQQLFNPAGRTPTVLLREPRFNQNAGEDNADAQRRQTVRLQSAVNVLGGIDAGSAARSRPDLFGPAGRTNPALWTPEESAVATNNVYRSIIVPPPSVGSNNEYPNLTGPTRPPDDASIEARRGYTQATLIMTIGPANATPANAITFHTKINGALTNVTALYNGVATATNTATFFDARESTTTAVRSTTINVGTLATRLAAHADFGFNGTLYVNQLGSSGLTPAAIRLTNAAFLPNRSSDGFSIVTNGGVYVQGNYNTRIHDPVTNAQVTVNGTTYKSVPAMIMADAITVLSAQWNDGNSKKPLANRVVNGGTTTINAGLLAGYVPTNGVNTSSGGVQNLVRYLEDWGRNQHSMIFFGSLSQLFNSTQFDAPFPGTQSGIYNPPNRTFNYNLDLATRPPPSAPTIRFFDRGAYFNW